METVLEENRTATIPGLEPDEVRIAIVEDDPMFRHALEHYLRKVPGNRVYSFDSGEECFRHYDQLDPEILILDYRLDEETAFRTGMNGLDILREVKSSRPDTEVIFVSGQENTDVATAAIRGGASEYILKNERTMPKMLTTVNRLSLFIRIRREESRTMKWICALLIVAAATVGLSYFAGFSGLPAFVKIILIASAAGAGIYYFILMRSNRKKNTFDNDHLSGPDGWID